MPQSPAGDDPLFIVGPSRSGTAMLRSVVNQSASIGLAGETHYFDDLRPRFSGRDLDALASEELDTCLDYFRRQTVRPYGKGGDADESWMSRGELLDAARSLKDRVEGTDALFEAFCRLTAEREGAAVWGEKTPRHVFRIDDILSLYPRAKVACMVRDPRAVVASYRDWRYQGGLPAEGNPDYEAAIAADEDRSRRSYHIVIATMMWKAAVNSAAGALARHGPDRVRVVRYEDVVADPHEVLGELCGWLGIPFEDELLEVPLHNSSSSRFTAGAGISKAPQDRWKTVLSERETGVIEQVAGQAFRRHGYEPSGAKAAPWHTAAAYATLPFAAVRAVRANRDRFGSLPTYVLRRLRAVMGN